MVANCVVKFMIEKGGVNGWSLWLHCTETFIKNFK